VKATISVDHRVSDGAEAAQFMQKLEEFLENPLRVLV
jgi:pyruvate dehydrogenase E2 component (dihydrolipoamide acetyltransferase)